MSTDRSLQMSCLSDTSSKSKPSIYNVHAKLRSQNEQAYEPEVVSIGPYHRGKPNLEEMEKYKLIYLQGVLSRRCESSTEKYIKALKQLEVSPRSCYAEEINLSEDGFVEMMFCDGLFIIEFLRKVHRHESNDPILAMGWRCLSVARDLILVENQVPFSVLEVLFELTRSPNEQENLTDLALWLTNVVPNYVTRQMPLGFSGKRVHHLLDIVHRSWCSSFDAKLTGEISESDHQLEFIKSTSELQQSGIKFEMAKDSQSWLDITFKNGVIKIPHLKVQGVTESVFRNLIAYEEYMLNPYDNWRCVKDYAVFMDRLIDSSRDVEKLRRQGIIENWLGDDEAVCTLFNNLNNNVSFAPSRFCYWRIFKDMTEYAGKRRNIWRAHLIRSYFNNPWAIISFLAAFVLLLLTITQTTFSILQYAKE